MQRGTWRLRVLDALVIAPGCSKKDLNGKETIGKGRDREDVRDSVG